MLSALIGEVQVADSILQPMKEGETAASPGMKYKHYAPNAEVVIVLGTPEQAARKINSLVREAEAEGKRCEIAATEQTKLTIRGRSMMSSATETNRSHSAQTCNPPSGRWTSTRTLFLPRESKQRTKVLLT
jgi:L-threonylcarbamoyladenylate synthase